MTGNPSSQQQKAIVDRLQERLEGLPLLPTVVMRLLRLDSQADNYFEEVSNLIGHDPPFAARILKTANSAAFGPTQAITTLREAVMRIGARGAVNLVISHSATRVFLPRTDWERGLWVHALGVANVAKRLAPHMRARVNPDEAYLAGLLHDVGRFILYLEAPDALRAVDETSWETPTALIQAEKSICGFTHAELGSLAAQKWQLPHELTTLIQHHHESAPVAAGLPPPIAAMVDVVRVADWLAVTWPKHEPDGKSDLALRLVASQARNLFTRDTRTLAGEVSAGLLQASTIAEELGL